MYGGLRNPGSSTAPFRPVQYAETRTNSATKQANTVTGVDRSDFIVLYPDLRGERAAKQPEL
jgi:hypothetical protein